MNSVEEVLAIEQKQEHELNQSNLSMLRFRKTQAVKNYFIRLREPMRILTNVFSNTRNDAYFESGDRLKTIGHILAPLNKAIEVCKEGAEFKRSPVYRELGRLMEVTAKLLERFKERLIAPEGSWRRIKSREKAEKKFKRITRFLSKKLKKMSEVLSTPSDALV